MSNSRNIPGILREMQDTMKAEGITAYMVPTADFHNSEYVDDYFKCREYLTGFTGSNGTVVISENEVGLWTDGRYFIQAEKELAGSGVVLYRMGEEGVPTIREYLADKLGKDEVLGFDGRVVDAKEGIILKKILSDNGASIEYRKDLTHSVWKNCPSFPEHDTYVIDDSLAGESVACKLERVRGAFGKNGASALVLSKLDDIMWLTNIRGNDVECNPVVMSYMYIDETSAHIYISQNSITPDVKDHLNRSAIEVHDYFELFDSLSVMELPSNIQMDLNNISYSIYAVLNERANIIDKPNPTELYKAVKNPTELKNIREVYIRDSAVLTRYIYWLKKNIGKIELNEYTAAMKLDSMRTELEGFIELSFPTIGAYKENAAMMHYEATKEDNKVLEPDGMYLVDSGGQYMGGTTDVTRTIVLGNISEDIKKHFTLVAVGMLRLAAAKFLSGCTGRNVDILAREPLWNIGIDYKCGTGHGIGYILNVHEGPHNIRWRYSDKMNEVALEAGMIVSDEPGVYIEGSHGIRTENIIEVVDWVKNGDGRFLTFEHLTFVPIDLEAINTDYMQPADIELLNSYHAKVYEMISPFMQSEEERVWLREATKAV